VVRTKFGVDDEICTGDHSCIRPPGCPSLTVKPSPDPLRTVRSRGVSSRASAAAWRRGRACGLLCRRSTAPSDQNASAWDRFMHRLRRTVISWLAPREVAA
jgi:indolepyruvate ferredoxin oxidoreductase alpha subunit